MSETINSKFVETRDGVIYTNRILGEFISTFKQ